MAEHAYTIAARVLTLGDSSPKWIAGCIGDDSIAITADAAWKSLEGKLCLKSALAEQEIDIEFSSDSSAPTASVLASAIDPRIIAAPGDLKVWAYAEGEDTRIQTTILTEVIEGARAKEYTFEYPVTVQNIGTKEITANGTYDAADDGFDAYSSVTVNVESGPSFGSPMLCSVMQMVGGVPDSPLDATLVKVEGVFEVGNADPAGDSAEYNIASGTQVTFGLADGIGDAEHDVTGKLYDVDFDTSELTELSGEVELDGHLGVIRVVSFTVPAVADGHGVIAGLTVAS